MKNDTWKPVTESAAKPPTDPLDRPIDFTLTPAERDIAKMAMVEVLAMQRSNRASFSGTAPGLRVESITDSELTDEERKFFGIGGEA